MRIVIDLLIADKETGGMLLATRALLDGLSQMDHKHEIFIITGRPKAYQSIAAANIHIHAVKLLSWRGILIQHQLLLPGILKKLRPDVLHIPAFAAPIGWHGPLVMTVHDLGFLKIPGQSSSYARFYWQHLLRESVQRAQHIIAVSEQTRDELIAYWEIEPERIHIVHNALRAGLGAAEVPRALVQNIRQRYGEQYLLHVGRIMPRKNVETLVQAFDLLAPTHNNLQLVLTGGAGYGSKEVLTLIEESAYKERIHLTGWVSDQELAALYAGGSVLVFPSKHEGFGLPIIEAMARGMPVIASPEAASREIAGDAVVRTDCTDAQILADAIIQVLTDNNLRNELMRLGRIQAQPFTIEACARATLQVYQEAFERQKTTQGTRERSTINSSATASDSSKRS